VRYWKPKPVPGTPLVGIAAAAHVSADRVGAALVGLVYALKAQTYVEWLLDVTHDGPADVHAAHWLTRTDAADPRVTVTQTPARAQQFGHPHRQAAVERLLAAGCEWVGLTNQDNYYAPTYLEWLLHAGVVKQAPFVYCDCVHSHKLWTPMPTRPKRGHIDLGGFLAHRSIVEKVKFDKFTFSGDADYITRLVQAAGGKTEKVTACLFVHN